MSILEMSASGAVMVLAILVIRALTINRLPKKTFLALWGIALVRLLIPYSLPSALSVYSLLGRPALPAETNPIETGIPAAWPGIAPVLGTDTAPFASGAQAAPSIMEHYVMIWAAGALVCSLFFAVTYLRCRREFRESLPVDNEFAMGWLKEHPLRRTIQLRQLDRISAPLTYGVFRPVILLPKHIGWNDEKTLAYVLAHEYVHIRRFDAVTKLMLTAALCVHWFNPAVWLMYAFANRDLELSCDETVVRLFGEGMKSEYAMTLIRMEETRSGLRPLCNHFSKHAIEERIIAIMKTKKTSLAAVLVALALIASVTTAFATSAQTLDDGRNQENPDRKLNSQADTVYSDSTMMSYTDSKDGKTYYSWDDGKTWTPLTEEELDAMNPALHVEWWTAEEYKVWLDQEKVNLQSIIGSQGWTPSTGWFTWTQEMVDNTIAQYEDILRDIENGMMVSKAVCDENGNPTQDMMSCDPRDFEMGTETGVGLGYFQSPTGAQSFPEGISGSAVLNDEEEAPKYSQNELHAEMEWTEEKLAPYLALGLDYHYDLDNVYEPRLIMTWQGKPVRRLFDAERGLFVANSLGDGGLGEDAVDLETVYDSNGNLTGLKTAAN